MKLKLLFTFLVVNIVWSANAQNLILNGSFENNTATGNMTNLTTNWSGYVANSWQVDAGSMNLDSSFRCGGASDGNWFVTNCPMCNISSYLGFSLKFASTLILGHQYALDFDRQYCGNLSSINVGLSNDSTIYYGNSINTWAAPGVPGWVHASYTFQAAMAANYLMVGTWPPLTDTGFIAMDNFRLTQGPCTASFTMTPDATPHNWIALDQSIGAAPISYKWVWGDGDTTAGANVSHTYSTAGNYNICLNITDGNGCLGTYCDSSTYLNRPSSSSTMVTVTTFSPTVIHDPGADQNDFIIFPNPAKNSFQISSHSEMQNACFEILNVYNELVYKENISGLSAKDIQLKNISSGIYFVRVTDRDTQFVKKLVIQND